ncbi:MULTISPECIES: hypothetical protein [unclassified Paenibacillus]|uniref:hypothetical protein n=1 Tax=unclassified Paenibacillus TaxID=185978 RepID=UPI00070E9DA7|nr:MULTISPECIES: hypothetical protein [unclassified Paenibacillus]KQX45740.1 hypothetical protein ASD40_17955 [Paenibacillus sp. Root444D2]KRE46963.1 hypothetical protein ASG85_28345 [Paenibacillus sp. Soil724D2]
MIGNSMKKTGAYLLLVVSFLAFVMTWEVGLLSPLGGICIAGFSFGGAILMWLDVHESRQVADKKDAKRAKADL